MCSTASPSSMGTRGEGATSVRGWRGSGLIHMGYIYVKRVYQSANCHSLNKKKCTIRRIDHTTWVNKIILIVKNAVKLFVFCSTTSQIQVPKRKLVEQVKCLMIFKVLLNAEIISTRWGVLIFDL